MKFQIIARHRTASGETQRSWHVRAMADNNEVVWWTESYIDKINAYRAIELLSDAFAPGGHLSSPTTFEFNDRTIEIEEVTVS